MRDCIHIPSPTEACEQESELHQQIIDECKRREWVWDHDRMDKPSTGVPGSLDFVIAAHGAKTFWVEAKRKGQKPTQAQRDRIAHLIKLGHTAAVVWSFQEFLELVKV